ncbi:MAG: glycosyltransferase [Syntrophomonadaceae bacterium]|jgi:glycosyltransferase involved in cell wall biosynthesis|nr:glycosyltransferase [Syntrophomonadaceae bacterium]
MTPSNTITPPYLLGQGEVKMPHISSIIYPPTLDFHYLVQRPQQLMKSFSQLGIPSYFMNVPNPLRPVSHGLEKINQHLYVFNHADPYRSFQPVMPVVYFSATWHINMVHKYNPSLIVFDSVDEPCDEFASWRPHYHKAVTMSDIVLATSDPLYQAAKAMNPNTFLVPNGCDFEFFSQAQRPEGETPSDIAAVKKPIIGYIGAVASWLDLDLLEQLALSHPEYNIVMIGPMYNVHKVPQPANIHWLGFKDYDLLPSYARVFDVGIIPFKNTRMVSAVNPIKMWEYMAVGMPIVTTAVPETLKHGSLLWYSRTREEFFQNISAALNENSEERKNQRREIARHNSWLSRAQSIKQLLENALETKKNAGLLPENLPAPPDFERFMDASRRLRLRPYAHTNHKLRSVKARHHITPPRNALISAGPQHTNPDPNFTVKTLSPYHVGSVV